MVYVETILPQTLPYTIISLDLTYIFMDFAIGIGDWGFYHNITKKQLPFYMDRLTGYLKVFARYLWMQ